MTKLLNYIFIILTLPFFACSSNQTDPNYFIAKFNKEQNGFDSIIKSLRSNTLLQSRNKLKIFRPSDFDITLKDNLMKLGITEIVFYTDYCNHTYNLDYDLKTNWTKAFPVHLTNLLCKSDENTKGAYLKSGNKNEGWGLGDNWILWFEHTSTKGIATYYDKQHDTANLTK